jgi:hypothetical protein
MNLETLKYRAQRTARRLGIDVARITQGDGLDDADRATVDAVGPFTMTSPERIVAVCDAVRYVSRNGIAGDVVECGVWRGGSMMAAARTLLAEGDVGRDLYLYDTFAGMTEPTDADHTGKGAQAGRWMRRYGHDEQGNSRWCNASVEDVDANIRSTGYPMERVHLVVGPVEQTIPDTVPGPIALLRLDTDWYESTAHEMAHLFDLVVPGGVLILDDYGHWQGARKAVDEHLERIGVNLLLHRIDYTGRMAIVPDRHGR